MNENLNISPPLPFFKCCVDYEKLVTINILPNVKNVSTDTTLMQWEAATTVPFNSACIMHVVPPSNLAQTNFQNIAFQTWINNSINIVCLPVRFATTRHIMYGLKEGDVIKARIQYAKSMSSSPLREFQLIFAPYI